MNRSNISAKLGCVVSLALLVSACGGGGGGGGGKIADRSPDPVSFADGNIANAVPGFIYMSPAVLVSGIDAGETIAAAVEGGEISVNGAAFAAGPADVVQGDALRLRAAAPGAFEDSVIVTLALGDASNAEWRVSTPASTLDLAVSPKRLDFAWAAMQGADRYRLLENPDGASGYVDAGVEIAGNASSAGMAISAHLIDWNHAKFALEACQGENCVMLPGHEVGLEQSMSVAAINYLKPEEKPTGYSGDDTMGTAVATNADGSVVAVGGTGTIWGGTAPGRVQVYRRGENGELALDDVLYPADPTSEAAFGSSVGMNSEGTRLVIGAPHEAFIDPSGETGRAGAVYVYERTSAGWQQIAHIVEQARVSNSRKLGLRATMDPGGNHIAFIDSAPHFYFYAQTESGWESRGSFGPGYAGPIVLRNSGRTMYLGDPTHSLVWVTMLQEGQDQWGTGAFYTADFSYSSAPIGY